MKTFNPNKTIYVNASKPHPPNTKYKISVGYETWETINCEVIKVQMEYDGKVSGRRSPSYPLDSDDYEKVNKCIQHLCLVVKLDTYEITFLFNTYKGITYSDYEGVEKIKKKLMDFGLIELQGERHEIIGKGKSFIETMESIINRAIEDVFFTNEYNSLRDDIFIKHVSKIIPYNHVNLYRYLNILKEEGKICYENNKWYLPSKDD